MTCHRTLPRRRAGFTLAEVAVAMTVAMILLFSALVGTAETSAIVSEGDGRLHSEHLARKTMDRIVSDCRYASDLQVAGNTVDGWTITIDTTSALAPPRLIYAWDPDTGELTVSDDAGTTELLFGSVAAMDVRTTTESGVVTAIALEMEVSRDTPEFAGAGGLREEQIFEVTGSVRIRLGED